MRGNIGRWRALASAGFAVAVLALAGFGLHQVAGKHWRVQPTFHVRARFASIGGLEAGIAFASRESTPELSKRSSRPPSRASRWSWFCASMNGSGTWSAPTPWPESSRKAWSAPKRSRCRRAGPMLRPLAELGTIASERPVEMNDLLKKAAATLARLDAASQTAEQGLGEFTAIAGSIRRGEGSLGKLMHDDSAYHDLIDLAHRGEHSLTALDENLTALKQTWPLSRYFDRRAYLDRERVLFQPGSHRHSRAFRADDLFEPGRSILTPVGQTRLDEIGRWCKQAIRPNSEVVIAAFTDGDHDEDLAEILTQEQAESVRRYLVDKHSIQSAGWFKSRKVAAVGFGSHVPRTLDGTPVNVPARRVEIILFTPQT